MVPRIAVVLTVMNEADSIASTVHEIFAQASPSTEVIVVDAGSTDGTREKLAWLAQSNPRLRVIEAKGCSRGQGRNLGIRSTTADIIVVTDGGCIPQPGWFDALTGPLINPVGPDVVGGYWVATYRTAIGRAAACFTTPPAGRIKSDSFLPSSRCIAYRRCCFECTGGYPDAQFGEDTAFDLRLKAAGCRVMFVPEGRVTWPQRENLVDLAKQFFNYGRGSGRLGLGLGRTLAKVTVAALWSCFTVLSPSLAVGSTVVLGLGLALESIFRGCPNPVLGLVVGSTIRLSALVGEIVGNLERTFAVVRERTGSRPLVGGEVDDREP